MIEANRKGNLLKLILSMCIFGTVGIFRRMIPYSSALVSLARGVIGLLFLLLVLCISKRRMEWVKIKTCAWKLLLSGFCLGANWALLFEAYNYTSVSVATVCYYIAPVFATVAAVFLFKDRITVKKIICMMISCVGLIPLSGVLTDGFTGFYGILLGLGAAVLYAAVVLLNRSMKGINSYDRTVIQLAVSSVAMGVYVGCTDDFSRYELSYVGILLLILVGVLHTGVAYVLYFGTMNTLPTQTVAIFSYIDPVLSILLSSVVLREVLTPASVLGMVLILGGTVVSEINFGTFWHKRSRYDRHSR